MAIKYKYSLARKIADRITRWLIEHERAPEHYYLLTVPGRKTGLPRTKPVALVENGAQKWLVAPYGEVHWVLNARAAGEVVLKRGEYQARFGIQELPIEERAWVLKEYVRLFPITRPYFDAQYTDPADAFLPEAPRCPVFLLRNNEGENLGLT